MKNTARTFLITLLFSTLYLLFSVAPVHAQTTYTQVGNPAQSNPYAQPDTNPDVPKNLHTWTQSVMIEVMSAMTCQLAGIDPINLKQGCLGVDQLTNKIGFVKSNGGGAIGMMGNMIAMLYTPPLHTNDYVQYLAGNFGIAKPAYAQGIGLTAFKPLLSLWLQFRNVVYFLFIVVFVIVGLAIMLRVRIDPRTVMTIENQIPKIIIGILLVTFSFAIAGFLFDLMWMVIYLTFNIFSSIAGIDISRLNPSLMQGHTPLNAAANMGIGHIIYAPSTSIGGVVGSIIFDNPMGKALIGIISAVIGFVAAKEIAAPIFGLVPIAGNALGVLTGVVGAVVTNDFAPQIASFIVGIIAYLIIAIAVLYALFRLWFVLLYAYISILLDVVTAPFWIIAGILPGGTIGFGSWLRDIAANLLAFPVTIGMFLLGKAMMDGFSKAPASTNFYPPLIGNPGDPSTFGAIIGLGFILFTPNVVNTLKGALKAPQLNLSPVAQAVGVGMGATNVPAQASKIGHFFLGLSHLPGHERIPLIRNLPGMGAAPIARGGGGHGP